MNSLSDKVNSFFQKSNRWYCALAAGFLFGLGVPPFNAQLHPALLLFPLLSFAACVPLFYLAVCSSRKRSLLYTYLFGIGASAIQFYWIAFVAPEGLWHLILLGVFLITLVEGLFYLAAGMLFRFTLHRFPKMYILFFPALWVAIEYVKTLGGHILSLESYRLFNYSPPAISSVFFDYRYLRHELSYCSR